jgi:hypothetical protein
MANLTITVDEATLKRARIRAIERGESVNKFLAEQLRKYAEDDETEQQRWRQDREHWRAVTKKYARDSGGWKWNREELYEERLERHQKPSA